MTKVALVGTACCGKTTVFELLRETLASLPITFVPESARIIAKEWPELFSDESLLMDRQCAIARRQIEQELRVDSTAKRTHGVVILDRCILDTYLYSMEVGGRVPWEVSRAFQMLMPTYDIFCLFDPNEVDLQSDIVRDACIDDEMRVRWHNAFVRELSRYSMKTVRISGNIRDRAWKVGEVIKELLHSPMPRN